MSEELTVARAELDDPATPAARLSEIAAQHPTLAAEIARHPNIYPELRDWLQQHGSTAQAEPVVAAPTRPPGDAKAGKAPGKAGRVVSKVIAAVYGLILVFIGIIIASAGFGNVGGDGTGAAIAGIVIAVYGVYVALPIPGFKLIIW